MLNYLRSSVYALTGSLILSSVVVDLSFKITKKARLLPVGFKSRDFYTD